MRKLAWTMWLALASAGCGDDAAPVVPMVDTGPRPDSSAMDAGEPTDASELDADELDGAPDGAPEDGAIDAPEEDASVTCVEGPEPTVAIIAPTESTDPNADEVVTSMQLVVQCMVTQSADPESAPVDSESVRISRLDQMGNAVDAPAVVSMGGGLFETTFNLESVSNGPLSFECFAADTAEATRCGVAELSTLLDLGPLVEITEPSDMSVHSQTMEVAYSVEEAPINGADTEAGIAGHTLRVAGVEIGDVAEPMPGRYRATIDLEDNTVFGAPLNGAFEISVTATNMRTPTAVSRSQSIAFTADSEGPTIEFESPTSGDLVGGLTTVEVRITDNVGVNADSAILRVGMTSIPLRDQGMDIYSALFDASQFPSTITELTLQVTASDLAGNNNTTSQPVKLDSVPPIASLDVPMVREARIQSSEMQCSTLFDPLGSDSVDDGETAGTQAEFRARVNDLGNSSFGGDGTVTFLAGVSDVGATELLILDDHTTPLLVDTTGDGVCDSINPDIEPSAGNPDSALVIELEGVQNTGQPYYSAAGDPTAPGMPGSAYTGAFDSCVVGTSTTPPDNVCDSFLATRVIYPTVDGDRAIFARPPFVSNETCVGDAFDFQASLSEGWACAAVRVTDRLGNTGVSPALRVCFDDGVSPDSGCPVPVGSVASEMERPDCNPGCAPPASFVDFPRLQRVGPP